MIYNKCIYGCIYVLTVYFPDVHNVFCIDSILNLSTRRIRFRFFIIPYVKECTHTTMRSSRCSHHISDNSNFIHQLQIKHWQFYTSNSVIHSWHLTQNMTPVTRAYRPATMDQIILVAHLHHNMLMNFVLYMLSWFHSQLLTDHGTGLANALILYMNWIGNDGYAHTCHSPDRFRPCIICLWWSPEPPQAWSDMIGPPWNTLSPAIQETPPYTCYAISYIPTSLVYSYRLSSAQTQVYFSHTNMYDMLVSNSRLQPLAPSDVNSLINNI